MKRMRILSLILSVVARTSICASFLAGVASPAYAAQRDSASTSTTLVLPTPAQVTAAVAQAATMKKVTALAHTSSLTSFGCMVFYSQKTSPACVYGDPTGSHTLVLYGDSHAANWIAGFDAIGKYLHWKVVEITKAQCPAADIPVWNPQTKGPYPECEAFRAFALSRIKQLHPDVVVMASAGQGPEMYVNGAPTTKGVESAWSVGLGKTIDMTRTMAGKVVVLGDFAYGPPAGQDCVAAHPDNLQVCNINPRQAVSAAHNQMEQRTAQQHGALYVNTVLWFCTSTTCPAVVGGYVTRDDGFHVAPNYALWLSDALATAMGLVPTSKHS